MNSFRRFARTVPVALIALASLTCGGDSLILPKEGEPAAIAVVHGNSQSGTVGTVLPESLIVRVTDTKSRPVMDARVQFILVTNGTGGDIVSDTAITDADGQARARWFLGTKSGVQTVQARVVGFNQVNVTITSTAVAAAADAIVAVSGDGQTGTAGQALAESLVVRINDTFGNPVSGVSVGWSVSGGGSVSPTTVVTGADGHAAVERVLGSSAGAQTASATVAGLTGSPVVFNHIAGAGGPTALLKIGGDNQTAPAGTFVAESLQVRLVDGLGNGVAGRSVAFTPSPNNGSASPTSVLTDANGFAAARWTLGGAAGNQSLIAASVGFSVTFNGIATSDVPTAMAISAGNNQTATAGTAVPVDPSVRVRDTNNNGVANVSVTFTVTGGGGTVTGPSGSGASIVVSTDANGFATLTSWTLGALAGANTMSVTANGAGGPLLGSPLTFNATGTAGAASQITITTQPPATAASGAVFATAPVVQLRDAGGNPVSTSGVNVTVSLSLGSGTLNGTKTVQTVAGQATFNGLSISGLAGSYTLDFNSGSLTGATSSTISLSAGAPTRLVLTTQPSSSAQSGVAFAQQPVAQLQDAAGNPVSQSGVLVTASIASGGGTLSGTLTATTSASGVATFTNLAITGTSGGRTLDFTASGFTKATSSVITIGAGGATTLVFGVQPTNTSAGSAISPAVTVLVQDGSGNTVAGATNPVTIALGANPGGSTLSGTLTVSATNGVATFTDLSLDKVGTGYTLAASSSGLSGATSNTFNVPPGSATQLVFTQQPGNVVAGVSISPAVTVTAKDAQNNTVTGYSTPISLALGNNPGGGALTGGAAVTPVNGVATFAGLSINRTGNGYTLVANSGTLNQISSAFNVSPGAASQLVFTQQPSNSVAGSSIAPAIVVSVRDALGNTVTSSTTSITVAIGTNPPGNGVLSGTTTLNAVAGVATFSNLSIDKPGNGYTLTAGGGGLPTATSSAFNITVGSGNKLVFIVDPSNAQVGQAISPSVQVQIQDAAGNPVSGTNAITLVIGNNPGGATLTGGGPVNAVNGIATFSSVRLDRAGAGYTLTALSSGLVSATSASFDISPAATTTTINSDTPDPSRVGQDILVTFTVAVTAPGSGTPTGLVTVSDGTISCQGSVAAGQCSLTATTAGATTFTATYAGDVNFAGSTSAGVSHQVNAAATTMAVTSDLPDPSVVGQAVTVNFTLTVNGPGNGTPTGTVTVSSGTDSCGAVPVSAGSCSLVLTSPGAKTITAAYAGDGNFNPSQDTEAHTVNKAATTTVITADLPDPSGSGQAITVDFAVVATAPGSGTPTGTVTVSDGTVSCAASVAVGSCQLTPTTAGAKTLTATYAGDANFLTSADTEAHSVTAGATTTTITATTPSASVVGQGVTIAYSVTPTGAGTPTGTVTVTDGSQSCNATVAAGQCSITFTSAGARTLVASYGGDANFSGGTSAGFGHQVNTAATTTSLSGDTPDPSTVGQAYTVTYAVSVTAPGGGTPTGSVLVSDGLDTCTGTVAAGSCALTSTTVGAKTLVASYQGDGDYSGSSSSGTAHDVTAGAVSPSQSSVAVSPGTVTASSGGSATTITVTARDGANNPISGATVVLAASGSGNTLTQPVGVTNGSGVATGTLTSTGAGAKTVSATINGVGITQTPSVTVTPGPVDAAASTATVPAGAAGTPTPITVQGRDQFGNPVTVGGASVQVTVSGANAVGPLAATDNGDGTYAASYTPTVSGPDQIDITLDGTPISGSPFNTVVAFGSAQKLQLFAGNNQSATVGSTLATNPSVIVRDAGNNPVSGITVAFVVTAGAGSITSSSQVTNGSGVAGVGWTLGTGAGSNTLAASVSGLQGSPVVFSATALPGAPSQFGFIQQPSDAVAGSSIVPAVAIAVRDGFGNTVTSATTAITVAIGTNPPGNGTLSGTKTVNAVNGVATFSNLSIDKTGTGYTLAFNGGGLPQATSAPFDIQVGSGNQLQFIVQPSNEVVGATMTPAVQVEIQDAAGNRIPTATTAVTLGFANNPGGAALTGGGPVNAVAGVATFSNLHLDQAASGYTLSAQASGLVSDISHAFNINKASTTTTINSETPDPSVAGQPITVSFTVAVTAPGSGTPTGTVTVSDGTASCQGSVAAGSCQLSPATAGSKTLVASYAGDANFNGSNSAGVAHTVNKANTSVTITSDTPDPSSVGQAVGVDFSVTVSSPGSGTPTGNVTVSDGVNSCTASVAAGTCNVALLTVGARTLTAAYVGNANFNGSTSAGEPHSVGLSGSTTTITSHTPSPSLVGQPISVHFAVSGILTPTGTVTVTDGVTSCQGTLSAGSGSCNLTVNTAGTATLTASYGGDGLHAGSTSAGVLQTVNPAQTKVTIVSDNPDPSLTGETVAVNYTLVVAGNGGGTPTGNVVITVSDGSGDTCTGSIAAGTCNLVFTTAGNGKDITATYAGTADYLGDTDTKKHDVHKAATTTSLTGDTPDPSTVGQAYTVTYAVSVTAPGGGTPTGSVLVSDGLDTCTGTVAAGSCALTSTTVGAKTLVASYQGDGDYSGSSSSGTAHDVTAGAVSPSQSSVAVSPGSITASSGSSATTITVTARDGANNPISGATVVLAASGSGNTLTQPVGVTNGSGVATGTLTSTGAGAKTVSATINGVGITQTPSVTVTPGPVDAAASTATVPAGAAGTPTPITVQGRDQFGNPVTVGGASVQVTVSGANAVGPLAATDNGDGTYAASYTPTVSGPDQIDITLDGTPISGSPFNSTVALGAPSSIQEFAGNNQSAPIGTAIAASPTVIVRDMGSNPIPGVTVTFAVTGGGGSITSSSVVTNGSGLAAVGWTLGPTTGSHSLSATATGLSGSPVFFSATATPGTPIVAIVSHTPDPSSPGQAVTVSYTVTSTVSSPTGNVTVGDGVDSCIGSVAGGSCMLTLSTPGPRTLVASYGGDANFSSADSPGASQTVGPFATTTTITAHDPDPSVVGQGIAIDVTVTSGGGTPNGSVTVSDGTDSCILTLSAGSGSCVLTPSTPGAKTLTAAYPGNSGFASGSGTASHQVDLFGAVSPSLSTIAVSTGSITASSGANSTTITVTARDAFGNLISGASAILQVTGGSGDNLVQPSSPTDGAGQSAGTFSATGAGTRTASVTIDGTPVDQTRTITVAPDVLDPASSTAAVPDGQAGQVTTILIQGRDQFGNALTSGGGSATFVVTGANSISGSLVDNGDGTYTGSYTPTNSGTDAVDVLIDSQPIQGSPYTSNVT